MSSPVKAIGPWRNNAQLVANGVRPLGYLPESGPVLDPTYGKGTWWRLWQPKVLIAGDLYPDPDHLVVPGQDAVRKLDFRELPWRECTFAAVAYDPPYKLNGTPTESVDGRYGVGERATVTDRYELMEAGLYECSRVVKSGGYVLVKCQDMVCNGVVHWQTDAMTEWAASAMLVKVDSFLLMGGRAQPKRTRMGCPECYAPVAKRKAGRWCKAHGLVEPARVPSVQQHAERNYSTLLVFRRR